MNSTTLPAELKRLRLLHALVGGDRRLGAQQKVARRVERHLHEVFGRRADAFDGTIRASHARILPRSRSSSAS
jgi:hypothetical protein